MKAKQRIRIEIKEVSSDGTFDGILSAYNNVDMGRDLVEPGAFTKTIQEHGSEVPLLWQHKADTPIGKLTLLDGPDALRVKGQLLMELPDAQKAYLLIKAGIVKGLSIGFDTIKDSIENGVRRLKELRLWEGSIVTFPMNTAALITSVKGRKGETKEDFTTELAEVQLQDAGYQMRCALFQSLGSLVWAADMSKDERVAAAEITIQQFSDAFLAYLPLYLDWLVAEYGDMQMMGKRRLETKEGRAISQANKETLKTAHMHVKSALDLLFPLIDDEAGDETDDDATSESKAGNKSEPDQFHSAAKSLESMRSLLRTA